ncbi:MAG: glycosyltransferase family 4 protein [Methylomonas sp.]|nr:glycosyltransferase family 4 protein [Methylomonas sp.]
MNPINCLVVTTLYPNSIQFRHGVFVETRVQHLSRSGRVNIEVIAPVPWVPFKSMFFPEYSKLVDVPRYELWHGLNVYHPRYLVVPKIGMLATPIFLAITLFWEILHLNNKGHKFDIIDAHYYYPDGVAVAIVAKLLKIPLLITARGTDINLISNFTIPRKMIVWASKIARFNLAVCEALRRRMVDIGFDETATGVYRNGVDLNLFHPFFMRDEMRQKWNVRRHLLISVGYLIERKGHHLLIEAMSSLPDYELFIVGDGEWREKLELLAKQHAVQERVRFIGEVPQQQLPELYNIADALVLASSREGWANVLLEAMACGTPVVATRIWGTPEVVQAPEAGVLCKERSVQGIIEAVECLFDNYPDRQKTRQYAEKFSWQETTEGLLALISEVNRSNLQQ